MNRDRGLAAIATAGVGLVTDLLAFGGDFLIAGIVLVFSDISTLVSFLAYLSTFAAQTESIPQAIVQDAYKVALAVLLLVMGLRLASRYQNYL